MTSNIGSASIAATNARAGDAAYEAMKREVTDALRSQFRPEFLNRVDEVIVFHALTEADLAAIVDLLLADLSRRLAGQDLVVELTPSARALIVREGTDPAFGARPLKRTIQRLVENPLARALVAGEFKPGDRIIGDADLVSGTLVFSTEGATVVDRWRSRRDARSRAGSRNGGGADDDAPEVVAAWTCRRRAARGRTASSSTRRRPSLSCGSRRSSSAWRSWPNPLPAPAEALMPVVVGQPGWRPVPREASAVPGRSAGRPRPALPRRRRPDPGRPHRTDQRRRPSLG